MDGMLTVVGIVTGLKVSLGSGMTTATSAIQTESEHEAILDGPELDVDAPNAEPEPVAESKISMEVAYEAA
ncbi:hypothetical protein pdam_00025124 [Pocillopora damicornis]|uniref:Uncharacterized protein n=1 Tax=Pocillopora damicornis TaxID=46731 RepID=A0A3M6UP28_POCDA|nr:hypothetical protein pdam_00025124 [Pocillopora damicornis]